jgi:hypothetical protein
MTLLGTVRRLTTCALAASLLVWSVGPSGAENGQIAAGIAGGLIGGALIGGCFGQSACLRAPTAAGLLLRSACCCGRARLPDRAR